MPQLNISSVSSMLILINNFHFLCEKFKRMTFSSLIKLTLLLVSVCFIKPITAVFYSFMEPLLTAVTCLFIIQVIQCSVDYRERTVCMNSNKLISFVQNNKECATWFFVIIASSFFPLTNCIKELLIDSFNNDKMNFVKGLTDVQGVMDTLIYFKSNMFYSLCMILDFLFLYLIFFAMINIHNALKERVYLQIHYSHHNDEPIVYSEYYAVMIDKAKQYAWISLLISTGIIPYVMKQLFY